MTSPETWPEPAVGEVVTAPPTGQTILFAVLRLSALAVSTITSLVLIRTLTVHEFGGYAAASGVFMLISALGYLGIDQLLLSRQLAPFEVRGVLPRLGVLTLALTAGLATLWPGLATSDRLVLALLGSTRVMDQLRLCWTLSPQLSDHHVSRARREFTGQGVVCVGMIVAVGLTRSAPAVAAGGLVASALVTATAVLRSSNARPRLSRNPRFSLVLRRGFSFAASGILYSITNALGLAILPILASSDDVAQFRATMLIYTAALVLPVAINNDVLRPHLFGQRPGNRPAMRSGRPPLGGHILRLNIVMSIVIATLLLGVGRFGATIIFGQGYSDVTRLIVPLALAMPFAFGSSYIANVLIAFGALKGVVVVQTLVLASAVAVNIVLITTLGELGAAVSVCAVDVLALVSYLILWARLGRNGV